MPRSNPKPYCVSSYMIQLMYAYFWQESTCANADVFKHMRILIKPLQDV